MPAKKLATILVAFIATNGILIAIAPVLKLLFGQNRYSAAATNAQEQ
jgi:hypothetical protein